MHIQTKETFTKEDMLSFVNDSIEFLEIKKDALNINLRWDDKFLDKSFWLNYSNDFYNLKRLPIVFVDVNNNRVGSCEVNYNSYTNVMSLKFGIKIHQNKVFNNISTQYSRLVNLNDTNVEENWEISIPTSTKETRLITLENLNNKIVRATSIIVEKNHFEGYQTSILDNNKSFRFNIDVNQEHLINKMKLTYYIENNPNLFKEITANTSIQDILNEPSYNIENYIKILEMAHI